MKVILSGSNEGSLHWKAAPWSKELDASYWVPACHAKAAAFAA